MPSVLHFFVFLAACSLGMVAYVIVASLDAGANAYSKRFREAQSATIVDMLGFMPTSWVMTLRLTFGFATGFPGMLFGLFMNGPSPLVLVYAAAFSIPGMILPDLIVRRARNARTEKIHTQLIDGLRVLSNGLRASLSLTQSLKMVAAETPEPFSAEVKLVLQETDLGVPVEKALENLANRNPINDLALFVASVNTVHQMGGGLSEICDKTVALVSERFKATRKMETLTAEGRTQALVMALMPFVLLIMMYMIEPDLSRYLFTTFIGVGILILVVVLDLVGYYFIWKLTRIDL